MVKENNERNSSLSPKKVEEAINQAKRKKIESSFQLYNNRV